MSDPAPPADELRRSLVVPLFNEAQRVDILLETLEPWCGEPGREVVLVDDGSTDDTAARIEAFAAAHTDLPVRLLRLSPREGKGGAVRAGLLGARGACAVFTDADVPYGLEGVDRVFEAVEAGAPLAVGARDLPESDGTSAPPLRRLTSSVFRTWTRLAAEVGGVRDTQCGVKGFRRDVIPDLFGELSQRGFAFDVEVLALAALRGLSCAQVPVTLRAHYGSKVSLVKVVPALLIGSVRAGAAARRRAGGQGPSLSRHDALFAALLGVLVLLPLLGGFDAWGGRDWDPFEADLISARRSLLEQGELPLWMPYRVGGHDALADPQSLWASPLGALALVFGVPWGIRVFVVLAALWGALGAQRLGARLALELPGRSALALLLVLTTPWAFFTASGSPTFVLALAALPWLLVCVLAGRRLSYLGAGALLALTLWGGGVNHFFFHSLLVVFLIVARALRERRPRCLLGLSIVFGAAVVLAAPKLVPCFLLSRDVERPGSQRGRGAMTPHLVAHALLNRDAVRFIERPYHEFVVVTRDGDLAHGVPLDQARPETAVAWTKVGAYLGPLALLLALLGAASVIRAPPHPAPSSRRRDLLTIGPAALLFLWLSCGPNVTPSAWDVLHQAPLFSTLRSPERMFLYVFVFLAILAAVGLDRLIRLLREGQAPRLAAGCAALILLALLADVFPPAWRAYRQTFVEPRSKTTHLEGRFFQVWVPPLRGSTYYGPPVARFAELNVGVVNGYGAVPTRRSAIGRQDARYRGEAFLRGSDAQLAPVITARRIELSLQTQTAETLVVNQNWGPGWHVVEPPGATCHAGPTGNLEVKLPAGTRHVLLRYTTPGLWAGLLLLLLGLPALLAFTARAPLTG